MTRVTKKRACSLSGIMLSLLGMLISPAAAAEVTLIHMGDVHGHLTPRPSIRGGFQRPPKVVLLGCIQKSARSAPSTRTARRCC